MRGVLILNNYQRITITAADTIDTVIAKINQGGAGVDVNDGQVFAAKSGTDDIIFYKRSLTPLRIAHNNVAGVEVYNSGALQNAPTALNLPRTHQAIDEIAFKKCDYYS